MKIAKPRKAGFGRAGCFFVVIVVAFFWMGGQGLYTALLNRKPTVMSYDEYLRARPKATWLMLTNCRLALSDAAFKSYAGSKQPTELYMPVKSQESRTNREVFVLLATRDPDLMATFAEMQNLKSETEEREWVLKNKERVFPRRDVQGLVRFGIDLNDKDRRRLANLQSHLASDFIILDDGKRPELGKSLGFLVAGMVLLIAIVAWARKQREPDAAETY